jgi:ribosomal protein S18 acetylase RimI-like enzyme
MNPFATPAILLRSMSTKENQNSVMSNCDYPPLLNPIWSAATTRQSHLAYGEGPVRRYDPDVLPFAAVADHSRESVATLTALVKPDERVWLFEALPYLDPREWRETKRISGFQMLCQTFMPAAHSNHGPASVMLDPMTDAAAMNALKAVAFPGFFGMRTPEMGRYRGIRIGGELVAMAGERLALPGYREVSAVCTHPAHLGRGYAQQLTYEATAAILADGDIPFLHVANGNDAAIHIYQQLGYVRCADALFVQLERLGSANGKGR